MGVCVFYKTLLFRAALIMRSTSPCLNVKPNLGHRAWVTMTCEYCPRFRGSCKTLTAVGELTRWKQTFPLVPCSYRRCDDHKSDRCQRDLPRQLVILHAQIWLWLKGWRAEVGEWGAEIHHSIYWKGKLDVYDANRLMWRKDPKLRS